jgi:plastocyanin
MRASFQMAAAVAGLAIAAGAAGVAAPPPDAGAGSISGKVTMTRNGAPVDASGVVVYVVGFEEPAPDATAEIRQRGKRFLPALLPITAGQSVTFPNDDPFFHNVFSPSPARMFDLGQFPKGDRKTKRFPKVGIVDVFCNIHPEMAATVLVLPNRRFARAAAGGAFRIEGVPAGRWTLYAYSRRATSPARIPIEIVAGKGTEVTLTLEESRDDAAHPNKYGEKSYREPIQYYPDAR